MRKLAALAVCGCIGLVSALYAFGASGTVATQTFTNVFTNTVTYTIPTVTETVTVTTQTPPPAPPPSACNYYVSPNGDGSSGTSPATAWKTIAKLNSSVLVSGSVVCLEGGQTFSDDSLYPKSGVTYDSYGTGKALIRGPGNPVYLSSGVHDVVLKNLDVAGAYILVLSAGNTYNITLASSVVHDTPYAGTATQSTDRDWTVSGNTFRHTGDTAILVGATRETVNSNTISDAGWNVGVGGSGSHGIYGKGPDMTVSNNDIQGVLHGQAVSIRFHGARVFGNTIHDTPYAIAFFDYDTAPSPQGTSYVYSNRLWNISGWGFYYSGQKDPQGKSPSVSFVVASNTFLFSAATEATNLSEVANTASVRMANNVFGGSYGSAYRACGTCTEDHNAWAGTTPTGTGDIHSAPLLSDPPELKPQPGSPVVDAGILVADLGYAALCDGQPLHYCGAAPDIGAVEYG